jgi:hypothetical protein
MSAPPLGLTHSRPALGWAVRRTLCSRQSAPYEPDDNHQETTPHAPTRDVAEHGSEVESSPTGRRPEGLQDCAPDPTPENAGEGIPQGSQALVFQSRASHVAADGTANNSNFTG